MPVRPAPSWRRDYPKTLVGPCCCWKPGRTIPNPAALPDDVRDLRGLGGPKHQWGYQAEALPGRTIAYARGRLVGGTGAINAAAAQWGRPADFAAWYARGLNEWGWADVEPWFRRLETDRDAAGGQHGRGGPIPITRYRPDELIPIQLAFHAGCLATGFTDIADTMTPLLKGLLSAHGR